MTVQIKLLLPGEGAIVPDPIGLPRRRKASAIDTGGRYTLHESTREPGQGAPPHVHAENEEAFYVLAGSIDFILGEERVSASAGTFLLVPRGTTHAFEVRGDAPASYLCIFSPPPFESSRSHD